MCGEHADDFLVQFRTMGSSPHVRGAPWWPDGIPLRPGIIPACAGSTQSRCGDFTCSWDHPRMCGEHMLTGLVCWVISGSSPHVRGARWGFLCVVFLCGIIPACAGSTERIVNTSLEDVGSSPHVRGAPSRSAVSLSSGGIIPACAGSTARCSRCWSGSRDHPRMCGEHFKRLADPELDPGSSPHVRGAPPRDRSQHDRTGIIPACAGSTFSRCRT